MITFKSIIVEGDGVVSMSSDCTGSTVTDEELDVAQIYSAEFEKMLERINEQIGNGVRTFVIKGEI